MNKVTRFGIDLGKDALHVREMVRTGADYLTVRLPGSAADSRRYPNVHEDRKTGSVPGAQAGRGHGCLGDGMDRGHLQACLA